VSDRQFVVMTRRELAAYFYSPVAYLVLLMTAPIAGLAYIFFYHNLQREQVEPIVTNYLGDLFSVLTVTFIVPALTMRLVSEERRTGTYEVLMSAPVGEVPVVLSKLVGSLIFFMLTWGVWAVFLLALRADQEQGFEYRPLLSYYLAVAASGLSFLAMGLFFSCVTRSQIVAAVLTFAGMLFWLFVFFAARLIPPGSEWRAISSHLAYVNLWWDALGGRLHLRDVMIQLSVAAFWTFLAVKVLEARRWS
jgi:ABC-2 type transport system permease protein